MTPTPNPLREALVPIAARIMRLEGGCETGHRAGQWHIHETPYLATGRQLAGLALVQPAPALDVARLQRIEAAAEALIWDLDHGHPTTAILRAEQRLRAALAEPQP